MQLNYSKGGKIMAYYYKSQHGFLKQDDELKNYEEKGYVQITEEEWNVEQAKIMEIFNPTQGKGFLLKQINEYKDQLRATDYQAIKYAEGWLSEQEYASIKTQRQQWRDAINSLEQQVANIDNPPVVFEENLDDPEEEPVEQGGNLDDNQD